MFKELMTSFGIAMRSLILIYVYLVDPDAASLRHFIAYLQNTNVLFVMVGLLIFAVRHVWSLPSRNKQSNQKLLHADS